MLIIQLRNHNRQSGISLIEVLVLAIIMSIGLLGIIGLQVAGIKMTTNSVSKTQALILSEDLISRIRANRNAVIDLNGIVYDTNYKKSKGSNFPTAGVTNCLTSTGCTFQEMAKTDLFNWSQLVKNSLPANAKTLKDETFLCLDSNPTDSADCDNKGSTFVLQIGWNDVSKIDTSSTIQTYRIFFQP